MPTATPPTPPAPPAPPAVEVLPNPDALTVAAAERVVAAASQAIAATGRFVLALSGGSTPRALYQLLATPPYASRIAWSRVQLFWGDERCVPPDDPSSNFRMTREALLDLVPLAPTQIHRIHGEDDPTRAAAAYQLALEATFSGEPRPRLDLSLLGIGDDGHTASLFPGLTAVKERSRWVMAEYVPKVAMWRVTLTPAALNASASVLFLVAGAGKAPALHQILEGPRDPDHLPAQVVAPKDGRVTWLVDEAAASALTGASRHSSPFASPSSSPSSSKKADGRP